METRLLLLDINGILCCKKTKNFISKDMLELKSYKVQTRPGCSEFLDFCYNNFSVGFFSSTTRKNAEAILSLLLTSQQRQNTILMWFRDRTHLDPDVIKDSTIFYYDTIKKLQDIFDNPVINEKRKYHSGNTILVDDSIAKTRFNDPKNIVICESFDGNQDDKVLYEIMEILPERFERLQTVRTV